MARAMIYTEDNVEDKFEEMLRDLEERKRSEIADFDQKCKKTYSPFCLPCAIKAVNEGVESLRKEIGYAAEERRDFPKLDFKLNMNDFTSFSFIDEKEIIDKRGIRETSGIVTAAKVVVGYYRNYVCNRRHPLSIRIPYEDIEAVRARDKKKE